MKLTEIVKLLTGHSLKTFSPKTRINTRNSASNFEKFPHENADLTQYR